jgi:hypothetical protein
MLTELPKELLNKVAWFMPLGGVPSRRLLTLGRVSKSLREAVRPEVKLQLSVLHGRKYLGLKRSYEEI